MASGLTRLNGPVEPRQLKGRSQLGPTSLSGRARERSTKCRVPYEHHFHQSRASRPANNESPSGSGEAARDDEPVLLEHPYTVHTQTRRGRRSKIFAEMELGTWLGDKCQEFLGASRPDADLGANDGAGVATGFSERNVTDYFIALAKRASSSDALFEQLQSQGLPSSSAARGFARASPPDSWPLWSTHAPHQPIPPHPTPPHPTPPLRTTPHPGPPKAAPGPT
jgi:hypothetical protein